jgi:cell wall-associated NlpC family hydrolase
MNIRTIAFWVTLCALGSWTFAARADSGPGHSAFERYGAGAQELILQALSLVGANYSRGGESPESGFDCSGLVRHVFRDALGLVLPRTSREISHLGEKVDVAELRPGDLVFFNTLRRAFSHVGIYLGEHRFVHAPASGGAVRVEDMRSRYWARRYNGARRIQMSEDGETKTGD